MALVMVSRPLLFVFLLIILVITSQFEWRQSLVAELEPAPTVNHRENQISKKVLKRSAEAIMKQQTALSAV